MAYWWVSQNRTFRHERAGGFIWAPLLDKRGTAPLHWRNVSQVRKGDTIFSYYRGSIVAIGEATSDPYEATKPIGFDDEGLWEINGKRVDVSYTDLAQPIVVQDIARSLAPHLPARHSPLTSNYTGVQGYLFALSDGAGLFLEGQVRDEDLPPALRRKA
jgi:putative restriction endonuclease